MSATVGTVRRAPAAVLWDMDGTLVDTEPYWFESERDLVESYGGEWPEHHAKAVVGFDLLDSAEYIREHGGVPLDPIEIVDVLLDGVIARLREKIPWRPGARRLLRELNEAGVPCALVTMSWRRFVDPVVAALPPGTFDAVITGDELPHGQGKPNPTPYLMAADLCGADARDCVAIEDSPTGVKSARSAGCRVLGVPNVRSLSGLKGLTIVGSLRDVSLEDLAALPERGDPGRTANHDDGGGDAHGRRDRRSLVLGALAVVALIVLLIAIVRRGGGEQELVLPPGAIPVDVWAPYWTLTDSLPSAEDRLSQIREVSPFWYGARGVNEIVIDENASTEAIDNFVDQARDSVAQFVPSIRDEMPAHGMATILANTTQRAQHIEAIRDFADEIGADGIDLDYEQFAFSDGEGTWAATSPNWVAFVRELAAALHDDGRTLTVSIPPVYDPAVSGGRGYWVYAPGEIAEFVDAIRIMGYDYSVNEPGPIAPLAWVHEAVDGVTAAVPEEYHDKLVLGVPAYGSNWVTGTSGTCPPSAEGKTTVTTRSVADLAALRNATPVYDPVTGEWSFTYDLTVGDAAAECVQSRVVRWVDAEGAAARAEIARRAGWGGVALWALGYDNDETWNALLNATRAPMAA